MVLVRITNLDKFEQELTTKIKDKVGFVLERNIRSIARTDAFDTGDFHNSIFYKPEQSKDEIIVEDGVNYGIHLEFGTFKMAPRAIFQRGLNITLNQLPELLASI